MGVQRSTSSAAYAFSLLPLTLIAMCSVSCGDTGDGVVESARVATASAPITDGDAQDVTNSDNMPERAVPKVLIEYPNGPTTGCTGSLIQRDVVLTAAHCFCAPPLSPDQIFVRLPYRNLAHGGAWEFLEVRAKGYAVKDYPDGLCNGDGAVPEGPQHSDLAVVFLDDNLSTEQLPEVLPVYTAGDLVDRIFNDPWSGFFQRPIYIVGWDGDALNRRMGHVTQTIDFRADCGFLGLGDCGPYYIVVDIHDGIKTQKGDSGGPMTFFQNGEVHTQFGVDSALFTGTFQVDRFIYSPTWNNGSGNGDWIAQFIDDADHDGVNDSVDNCTAQISAFCQYDNCNNPNQDDDDDDGIGDMCDNCPHVANAGQENEDGDAFGDACDLCVHKISTNKDADGDYVGDECDNCLNAPNPYSTMCGSDADCMQPVACPAYTGIHNGRCMKGPDMLVGNCSVQLDDIDCDGLGAACDNCEGINDPQWQIDSNLFAENREHPAAQHLGDLCDPVPQFVSVPIPPSSDGNPSDGTPDSSDTVEFISTAGLGRDLTVPGGADNDPTPYAATAGFRQCNCNDGGDKYDVDTCLDLGICNPDPGSFNVAPSPSNRWKEITISTKHNLEPPQFVNDLPRGQGLSRTFSASFSGVTTGGPRIGDAERLAWRWWKDLSFSGLGGDVWSWTESDGLRHSHGILWGHVKQSSPGASVRDTSYAGRLRDHYVMVDTPGKVPPLSTLGFLQVLAGCKGPACWPWYQTERWSPRPPDLSNPGIMDVVQGPARLVASNGRLVAFGDGAASTMDVTDFVSPAVKTLLLSSDIAWLSPVERDDRVRATGDGTQFAAISSPWVQASVIQPVVQRGAGLDVERREVPVGDGMIGAASLLESPTTFIPSDRNGARAVLTLTERAVFLVGGDRAGTPTGEIWRYDLDTRRWTRELPFVGTRPARVLALTYDYHAQRLLVLDEVQVKNTQAKFARLVSYDLRTKSAHVLGAWPKLGKFEKVSLTMRDDGSFFLTGGTRGNNVHVFRAKVAGEQLIWTGFRVLSGQLLDDPINSARGVVLPVLRKNEQHMVTLRDSDLLPNRIGCNQY